MKSYITQYLCNNGNLMQFASDKYELPKYKIGDDYEFDVVAEYDGLEFGFNRVKFEIFEIKQYAKEVDE